MFVMFITMVVSLVACNHTHLLAPADETNGMIEDYFLTLVTEDKTEQHLPEYHQGDVNLKGDIENIGAESE